MAGYPIANPKQNSMIPQTLAKIVIPTINLLIYLERGDYSPFACEARVAIWPMNVLSPVNITNPFPDPYLFKVEKKATFLVSNGFYLSVHSTVLDISSVYPVKDELSTFIPWDYTTLISAGIFFPSSILIKSPLTSSWALRVFYLPSRMTIVCGGIKSLKLVMIASDLMFW